MIRVENLTKSYGSVQALKDVSFTIEPGEIVGLLGPNGAGKTTTIKILTGYLHQDGGTVTINDLDILTHTQEVQADIGYLPENTPLYHDLSVQGYLKFVAGLRQIPADQQVALISEAITVTGLTDHRVRLDDQSQVYLTNNLTSQDVAAQPASWIDTAYYTASTDDVVSLSLQNANGTFDFTKDGDAWTVSGLGEGETLNQDNFTQLLSAITALRMIEPVSKDVQDTFGMDAPQAVITLKVMETEASESSAAPTPDTSNLLGVGSEGTPTATLAPTATPQKVEKEYTFQIGAALDNGVVIKGSNSDYYVLISQAIADRFITKTQADFATVPPTPTPEPTLTPEPPTETPVPMSVPPTPEPATPEATIAPTEETPQPLVTPEPPVVTPSPG